jgi:hypothetical protein
METEFTVDTMVSRLASEQVQHVLDSVEMGLRFDTGIADVDLRGIISSLVSDMVRREGMVLEKYAENDSVAITDEMIAVESIWRILNPPVEKESYLEKISSILDIIWPKWKEPPEIEVAFVEPLPPENLERLKELIKKAALRKLKELEERPNEAKN